MMLSLSNYHSRLLTCIALSEEIQKKFTPENTEYQIYINELLVQVYAAYDTSMKAFFIYLCSIIPEEAKPLLVNTIFLKDAQLKTWVPPVKTDALCNYFEALSKLKFFDNIKRYVDMLVDARNSYAHTGRHTLKFEDILNGLNATQFLVRFIYAFYYDNGTLKKDKADNLVNSINVFESSMEASARALQKIESKYVTPQYVHYVESLKSCVTTIQNTKKSFIVTKISSNLFSSILGGHTVTEVYENISSIRKAYYLNAFGSESIENLSDPFKSNISPSEKINRLKCLLNLNNF